MSDSSLVLPVDSLEALEKLQNDVGADTVIVLYFHAEWASPCIHMAEGVTNLAKEYAVTDSSTDLSTRSVVFAIVLAEIATDISSDYEIESVPYTFLLRGGKRVGEVSGGSVPNLRIALGDLLNNSGTSNATVQANIPPSQVVNPHQPAEPSAPADPASEAATTTESTAPGSVEGETESEEDLFRQLEGLVKASPVMLFMKGTPSAPECGFSRKIVGLMREKNIRYGFFNILANQRVREGLKKYAEWPTYPQLWVQGELVGGLDIVNEEFANDPDFMSAYMAAVPAE